MSLSLILYYTAQHTAKMIWRDIKGYNGMYQVSNEGQVRSIERTVLCSNREVKVKGRVLRPGMDPGGYMRCALSVKHQLKTFKVHRLVAEAFIPNPENKETVNHLNGNKTDNRVVNLEWATRSENCQHSFDTGLQLPKRGEANGNSILTEDQVREIREYAKKHGRLKNRREMAEMYGVSEAQLKDVAYSRRNIWPHVKV